MNLPTFVTDAIARLEAAGHEAYLVGGVVRDLLMGHRPIDFDLCTDATPDQIAELFHDCRPAMMGARYGTVKIIGIPSIEITTYRSDGDYSDSRHPETVCFGHSLKEDLARRDFTMNAIAWHPEKGIIDPFGGRADIKARLIRCVGDPVRRFSEDALRILRGVRFAARLGFAIEPKTWQAARNNRGLISRLSAERLRNELSGFIVCPRAGDSLISFREVFFEVIPELKTCGGFQQHPPNHRDDILDHIAETVNQCPPVLSIRLAALLHDIGNPLCLMMHGRSKEHVRDHTNFSAAMTREILSRLRYPSRLIKTASLLITHQNFRYQATPVAAREYLRHFGPKHIFSLIEFKKAHYLADFPIDHGRLRKLALFRREVRAVLRRGDCYSLRQLAVNGDDLMETLGLGPGPLLGEILNILLGTVIQGNMPNNRARLLELAVKLRGDIK